MIRSKVVDKKEERISYNTKIFDMEFEVHGEDLPTTYACIKQTFDLSNAKILLEDKYPGPIRKYFGWFENLVDRIDKTTWAYKILNQLVTITNIYLDIAKDSYILIVVLWLVGGPSAVILTPTRLTSVFIYGMIGTLFIPLVLGSIYNAQEEVKDQKIPPERKYQKYFQAIVLCLFTPLQVTSNYEANKLKRRLKILNASEKDEVLKLMKEGPKVRRKYASYVRIELGMETYLQLSSQIILWLLSNTRTATVGGLQNMFQSVGDWFLWASIALSIKTLFFVYLKTEKLLKPHFPITSTIFLSVWIIVSALNRVLVTTLYFCPSLGLFDILGHWKRELIPYSEDLHEKMINTNEVHLYNATVFAWTNLNRWNYETNSPPSYTLYTGGKPGKLTMIENNHKFHIYIEIIF